MLMEIGIDSNSIEEQSYYKVGEMSIGEGSIHYLMMVTGLIEDRRVKFDEILFFLKKKERQRRMVKEKKMVYDISELKKNSS